VDREPAADDEMQRVRGIRFVEDDFAALERSAAGDAQHLPDILVEDFAAAMPVYRFLSTLSNGRA